MGASTPSYKSPICKRIKGATTGKVKSERGRTKNGFVRQVVGIACPPPYGGQGMSLARYVLQIGDLLPYKAKL